MTLEDTKAESLNAAFQKMERSLRLGADVDVFERLRTLDDRWDEGSESPA
jgi:hypothetical protein